MSKNIHGHKILDILSGNTLAREEVKTKLMDEYGADVEFHTCSSEGLKFDEIFDFFIQKSKVIAIDGKYTLNSEHKCG